MNFGALGRSFGQLRWPGAHYEFASPLGGVAWAVLLGIPVGVIALYFLKLRRRPVQVPSTLLWRRTVEDLHVNSLFQRLRRNLLLFLQLLVLALAMLALAGPRLRGTTSGGQRFALAIDESASMAATDVAPSRLAKAKDEARKVVNNMNGDDLAMVIAFSDRARVVSNYTSDRRALLARIDAIMPGQGTTSLRDALQVAAGLANPSKVMDPGEGVVATSVVTPKLLIYTDGGFPDVEGFSLGNLEPEVVVVGPPVAVPGAPRGGEAGASEPHPARAPSDNVAILALQTRRDDEKPDLYQVFGRVHNFRAVPVATEAKLLRHDPEKPGAEAALIDAIALEIPAQTEQSFKFDLPATGLTELEVRLDVNDAQPLDNRAFTLIGTPRKAQVLLVTPGNRYLVDTFQTPVAIEQADVVIATPDQAKAEPLARDVRAGRYDLVVYDRFRPAAHPEANTLYFGALPPGPLYEKTRPLDRPVILDWDVSHPLMQFVRDLSTVAIVKATGVELPPGSSVLIESNLGPIAFTAPREGYTDAVVTFPLLDGENFNTTWFKNISFPLFLFNSLQVLGNAREALGDEVHLPGQNVVLRLETSEPKVTVTGPDGKPAETMARSPQGTYLFSRADRTGFYHARWAPSGLLPFAVNQFDLRESDLAPRGLVPEGVPADKAEAYKIKIGYNPVAGSRAVRVSKVDWWKPLAAAALAVLVLEWYIYNRRVYI
jgi:Aerotolerance regulator N-terminal/von Willebrand factor type A domain